MLNFKKYTQENAFFLLEFIVSACLASLILISIYKTFSIYFSILKKSENQLKQLQSELTLETNCQTELITDSNIEIKICNNFISQIKQ